MTFDIDTIQNINTLIVSIFTLYALYAYNNGLSDFSIIETNTNLVLAHCTLDLFLTKKTDVFIHHILTIGFITYTMIHPDLYILARNEIATALQVEVSSIFLAVYMLLRGIKEKTPLIICTQQFCQICFITLFVYYRIYIYASEILFNANLHTNVAIGMNSVFEWVHFYIPIYGFYLLNLYWLAIIVRTLYKGCAKYCDNMVFCEWALQYSYMSSLVYAFVRYVIEAINNPLMQFAGPYAIFADPFNVDMLGISFLAITSYGFHNKIYKVLCVCPDDKLDITNNSNLMRKYVVDIFGIQMRSLGAVLCNLYYTDIWALSYISFINHVACFYYFLYMLMKFDISHKPLYYNETSNTNTDLDRIKLNAMISVPIVLDSLIIILNTRDLDAGTWYFIAVCVCGVINIVQPFYKNNHLVLHCGLLWFTMQITRANIIANNRAIYTPV